MVDNNDFQFAWLELIREIGNGMPSYECHQRYWVYFNCRENGFDHAESLDRAKTTIKLPKIIFEVE